MANFTNGYRNYGIAVYIIYLSFMTSIFFSCGQKNESTEHATSSAANTTLPVDSGKILYSANCEKCHLPQGYRDNPVNPQLFKTFPFNDPIYFVQFIKDTDAMINAGDPYAKALKQEYESSCNHHFNKTLTDREIALLYVYLCDPEQ